MGMSNRRIRITMTKLLRENEQLRAEALSAKAIEAKIRKDMDACSKHLSRCMRGREYLVGVHNDLENKRDKWKRPIMRSLLLELVNDYQNAVQGFLNDTERY